MTPLRWPRLGLRREILILLPVTVFLLVIVSGFALFAYRSAIELLTEDRQREVAALTRKMAQDLAGGTAGPVGPTVGPTVTARPSPESNEEAR